MTVVRFPVRVQLTVPADRDCEPQVERAIEAVDAALSRATRHAATLRLVHEADPDPQCRPVVDVRLTGQPLPLSAVARLRNELSALAHARSAALLARAATMGGAAAPRMDDGADRSATALDPRRLVLDPHTPYDVAYLVRSYDHRGNPVAAPLHGRPRSAPRQMHVELREIGNRDLLQALLAQRYGGSPPPRVFVVFRINGLPHGAVVPLDSSGRIVGAVRPSALLILVRPGGMVGGVHWQPWTLLQADRLELIEAADTPVQRQAIRVRLLMRLLRQQAAGAQVTDDSLQKLAADLLGQLHDDPPDGPSAYYWLRSRGIRLFPLEIVGGPAEDLPVAVFSEEVEEATGEEGGPGGGRGQEGADYDPPLPLDELLFYEPDPAKPFLGEPPVADWPPAIAAQLQRLITDAAMTIGMEPGRYAGSFVLAALGRISRRAESLGGITGSGVDGDSPRMSVIRRLVEAFTPLEQLQAYYTRVIAAADHGRTLPPPLRHNSASWLLHFYEQYYDRRDRAVASLFVGTCQDQLLDVLESSRREILRRQQNFAAYMRVTRALILLMLVDDAELEQLRAVLLVHSGRPWVSLLTAANPIDSWYAAAKLTVDALTPVSGDTDGPPQMGRVRETQTGAQVQDSIGRWWSREELDSVISTGRQQAFAVDPMLEKLSALRDTVERLRTAGVAGIDAEFATLLEDLRAENEDKTSDVRNDVQIAFGLASFRESDITTNASIGAELSGIHARADAVLRPLFTGPAAEVYVTGMRSLVSSELGKESLVEFLNIVGLTALAILCPPAAFAVGAVEAAVAVDTALEHRGIQRAMLGGEDIITKAQAEAELWGAAIGAALVFIPEVPGIARGAAGGVGAVARGEVQQAASVAGRQLVRRAAAHVAELAAQNLARTFVTECLKAEMLNLAISGAVQRFTQAVAREVEVSGHASVTDLPQLIGDALTGPPEGAS